MSYLWGRPSRVLQTEANLPQTGSSLILVIGVNKITSARDPALAEVSDVVGAGLDEDSTNLHSRPVTSAGRVLLFAPAICLRNSLSNIGLTKASVCSLALASRDGRATTFSGVVSG